MAQDDYLYQTVYKDPMQEYLDTDVSALRDVPTARDTTLFHKVSPGLTGISIDPYGSGGNYMTEWGRILTEGLDPIQKAQASTPVDTPVDTGGGGLDVVDTTSDLPDVTPPAMDQAAAIAAMTSNDAYRGIQRPVVQDVFTDSADSGWGQGAKDGGRIGKRTGGKVTLAKRGFGRAFTKAKK